METAKKIGNVVRHPRRKLNEYRDSLREQRQRDERLRGHVAVAGLADRLGMGMRDLRDIMYYIPEEVESLVNMKDDLDTLVADYNQRVENQGVENLNDRELERQQLEHATHLYETRLRECIVVSSEARRRAGDRRIVWE